MKKAAFIGIAILFALSIKLQAQKEKIIVHSQADLPRLNYKVDILPSEFLTANEPFKKLVAEYKKDILEIMDKYTIEDSSTLKWYYNDLSLVAIMESDYSKFRKYGEIIKNLETKPSAKLMSGIFDKSLIASDSVGENRERLFRENLESFVANLPWDIVEDDVQSAIGGFEIANENLIIGSVQSQFDPAVKKTGTISGETVSSIIGSRLSLEKTLPYKDIIVEVLQNYADRNKTEKKDIWSERDFSFIARKGLKPVVIGIWEPGSIQRYTDH